jgi:3-oxoacyl-[acyl-carrier protein] reductase
MKNILIAGAGKGIGLAAAQQLAGNTNVWAITRSQSQELADTGANIIYADLAKEEATLSGDFPEVLDGIIYCPGSINLKPFQRMTAADFLNDFEQNVLGAVRLIQTHIPRLKKSANAGVVLFSTVAAKLGLPYHSSIAVSKGGVEGLVKSLAAEYAGSSIRFNAIAPSLTDTNLAASLLNSPEKREASNRRHPLQRIGTANEMAAMAIYLLGDNASWITGQVIGIDGGMGSIK